MVGGSEEWEKGDDHIFLKKHKPKTIISVPIKDQKEKEKHKRKISQREIKA